MSTDTTDTTGLGVCLSRAEHATLIEALLEMHGLTGEDRFNDIATTLMRSPIAAADAALAEVLTHWPALTDHMRRQVAAIVRRATEPPPPLPPARRPHPDREPTDGQFLVEDWPVCEDGQQIASLQVIVSIVNESGGFDAKVLPDDIKAPPMPLPSQWRQDILAFIARECRDQLDEATAAYRIGREDYFLELAAELRRENP